MEKSSSFSSSSGNSSLTYLFATVKKRNKEPRRMNLRCLRNVWIGFFLFIRTGYAKNAKEKKSDYSSEKKIYPSLSILHARSLSLATLEGRAMLEIELLHSGEFSLVLEMERRRWSERVKFTTLPSLSASQVDRYDRK